MSGRSASSQHELAFCVVAQALVGESRTSNVSAQPLEFFALVAVTIFDAKLELEPPKTSITVAAIASRFLFIVRLAFMVTLMKANVFH